MSLFCVAFLFTLYKSIPIIHKFFPLMQIALIIKGSNIIFVLITFFFGKKEFVIFPCESLIFNLLNGCNIPIL